ncbi:MAG: ABC transporter permease [Dehalococcoidia bacterium]
MSSAVIAVAQPVIEAQQPLRRSVARRIGRSRSAQIGLLITAILVVLAACAPILAHASPTAIHPNIILQAPSGAHLFGTDDFGRDLLSRVLYGGRISILVGISVAGITTISGLFFGMLAGFYRRLDNPIMRCMDVLMAFPAILLAIGIMTVLGPQLGNVIAALAIAFTPRTARMVRGEILHLRERDFVQAAQSLGMSDGRLMLRHLLPNSLTPLLIQQTFILAVAILAESSLNFLGVGVPPRVATLGGILSDSREFLRDAPWMSLFPGAFISLLVLGVNLLGDGLRDVLDPRMRL